MARHRQRDLEAGGEGLGIVETRKRLWEDIDGTVVKNRPWTAAPEDRCRKRPRRVSKKQASVEIPSESVPGVLPDPPQTSSPTFCATNHAYPGQTVTNSGPFNTDAPAFLESWGLVSPPSSCADQFDFGQGSGSNELLLSPDG
jgi:hypothetical protein